jgi:RNA polymerase sigma-70 factor (ECF subfamily)
MALSRDTIAIVTADAGPEGVARIEAALEATRQRWPALSVDDDAVALAVLLRRKAEPRLELASEGIAELALALACARQDRAAVAIFESAYLADVEPALAHMRLPPATLDEVRQEVRVRLLVAGDHGPARLQAYAGQGALGGLVRVTAVRIALNLVRGEHRERQSGDDPVIDHLVGSEDPERQLIVATSRAHVRAAIAATVSSFSPRERNVLRLHIIERLNIDEIGALYGVHRATAARWIDTVRASLASETRRRLREGLSLDEAELDSALAAVRSQVDASFERVLNSPEE